MRILDAAQTRAALPMADAIDAVRGVMRAHAEARVHQPLRTVVQDDRLEGLLLLKPAATFGGGTAVGLKVVALHPGNADRGLPTISGFVATFDPETGVPTALVDGGVVTEVRTGAASAVAADLLAQPDAGDLALLGAGIQARAHLAAMAEVRTLRRVRVWNRTRARAEALAAWAAERGWAVEVHDDPAAAVEDADLVCTVTSSRTPVLEGGWLAPGCHVTAAGAFQPDARELATDVLTRAALVVVDARESALAEAGDLRIPVAEGALPDPPVVHELGRLLVDGLPAPRDPQAITVYESLGLAIQDVAAASRVLVRAVEEGLGIEIPWG